jgi:FKBP-type peptidyl-prolyl cis-trans isomerase FkpA
MTLRTTLVALAYATLFAGCSADHAGQAPAAQDSQPATQAIEEAEIMPGLTMKKLKNGYGRAAVAGDYASVHYTGWLYDESAGDGRGDKFDSSVDRGQEFQFPLGAGRVIKGWDEGVIGMLIGEKRELKIAPEMGYGDRGAGSVIPPGATLIFEVELMGLVDPKDAG